jgi:hypothetical protein
MSRNSIGIRPPDCSVAPPALAGRADDERDPKPRSQAVTASLERLVRLVVVFLPASHGGAHGSDESPDSDQPSNIHELFTQPAALVADPGQVLNDEDGKAAWVSCPRTA